MKKEELPVEQGIQYRERIIDTEDSYIYQAVSKKLVKAGIGKEVIIGARKPELERINKVRILIPEGYSDLVDVSEVIICHKNLIKDHLSQDSLWYRVEFAIDVCVDLIRQQKQVEKIYQERYGCK